MANSALDFENILGVPVTVTSGYRDPQKNARVGGAKRSDHLTDSARDLVPKGLSMSDAAARLKESGKYSKVINEGDHVHVSYNQGQNVAISDDDLLRALTGGNPPASAAGQTAPGQLSDDQLLKALTSGGESAKPAASETKVGGKLPPRFRKEEASLLSFGVPFVQDAMAGYATLEDVLRRARTGEPGMPIGENFAARSQELTNLRNQAEAETPSLKNAWALGLLTPGGGMAKGEKAVQGLMGLVKSGMLSGASMGAAYGLGTPAEDDSISARGANALTGALTGGAIGGALPVAGATASMVGRGIGSAVRGATGLGVKPASEAENMLIRALSNDSASAANLANITPDKPLTVMDVGGTNTQRLARRLVTQQGKPGEDITKFLTERAGDQSGRVLKDIKSYLSSNTDVYGLADNLTKARSVASAPLWEKAMNNTAPAISDRLKQFQADPDIQAGIKEGIKLAKREALAGGKPFVPEAYGVTGFDAAGDPIVGNIPTWRTWHAAKEGLDAKVESFRNEVTRQLPDTKEVISYDNLRKSLLKELDSLNPDYKAARQAWAGPSATRNAMFMGEKFLEADAEEIAKAMSGMSAAEKEFYQIGAARAIQDKANKSADNADLSKKLFGNNQIRSQIEAVFGKDTAGAFGRAMTKEAAMANTKNFVLGGSNTMNKAADFADPATIFAQDMLEGGLVGGPKGAIINPAMSAARRKLTSLFDMNPNTAAALGELLTKEGQDALPTLTMLLEKQAKKAARSKSASQAAAAANALVAGSAGGAAARNRSTPP